MVAEFLKEVPRPYYLKWFYFPLFPERRPDYLAAGWKLPQLPLGRPLDETLPAEPGRPDLLFLPMTDWHARIQRTQHLAMGFGALGSRCFYLNPHLGREFPGVYSRRDDVRVGLAAPRVLELHVHLPREPVYHHRLLTGVESERVAAGILRATGRSERVIQLVSFPVWTETALRLKRERGFPIVYDCHDLLSGFRAIARPLIDAEQSLLAEADLLCFSSQWLLDQAIRRRPELADKSMVLRNAVNPLDYGGPARVGQNGRPTIGYAGSLDFWFDIESIRLAATRHPEWDFVLIGRVESNSVRQLKALPNVRMEGELPYAELPARMSAFDVGVIPFLRMPLTLATNPLKLYEYFSLGLPVAATRLPELEPFGSLVYLADSSEDFVRQLERAVAEDSPDLQARRRNVARENTWRARCEHLSGRLAAL